MGLLCTVGTGQSDKPKDTSLWTIGRYVEEVETVRKALGLGRVHLLGQSWGTWLGFEYLLTYPDGVKSFVCANGTGEVPLHLKDLARLRAALGAETVEMMSRHEAEGTTDHPEYDAAVTRGQLQACVAACGVCAAECEQHAGMHEHCRVCAEACRECEEACRELLASFA